MIFNIPKNLYFICSGAIRNYKYIICAFLIIISAEKSYGQAEADTSFFEYTKQTITKDVKHIFCLGYNIVQTPFHFDGNDWLYVAGAGAATSSLFLVDRSMKQMVLSNQNTFNDKLFNFDHYMNGKTANFAGAAMYLGGFMLKEDKIRRMGLDVMTSLFIAGTITSALKYTFGRSRPYLGDDQMDFKIFRGSKQQYMALPSGHTTSAFAFASVMAMSVDNIYWDVIWYGSASMVALSRVYHNAHWLSDTFLAAIISYNVADYVVHFKVGDQVKRYSVYPTYNGLGITYYF